MIITVVAAVVMSAFQERLNASASTLVCNAQRLCSYLNSFAIHLTSHARPAHRSASDARLARYPGLSSAHDQLCGD